jgi:hypothetical protein
MKSVLSFFYLASVLVEFCDFSRNKICKTYLEPIRPLGPNVIKLFTAVSYDFS